MTFSESFIEIRPQLFLLFCKKKNPKKPQTDNNTNARCQLHNLFGEGKDVTFTQKYRCIQQKAYGGK